MVKKELHLQQVAEVLNIDLEELKVLNPQYKRFVIPAYTQPYPLRLKNADISRFIESEDSIYLYKYDDFFIPMKVYEGLFIGVPVNLSGYKKVYHSVKYGESLAAIANKYGLAVNEIKKMNNLSGNSVKSKQKLLVGYEYIAGSQTETQKKETVVALKQPAEESVIYIVQKGDSLSAIAAKYRTTAQKICDYNTLKNINAISVGQKLHIPQ
jgi:membrane-bound lytic murein transglycosylase D